APPVNGTLAWLAEGLLGPVRGVHPVVEPDGPAVRVRRGGRPGHVDAHGGDRGDRRRLPGPGRTARDEARRRPGRAARERAARHRGGRGKGRGRGEGAAAAAGQVRLPYYPARRRGRREGRRPAD